MANKKSTTAKGTKNNRWSEGVKATPVKLSEIKFVNKPTKKK